MNPQPDWHKPLPEELPRPSFAPPILAAGLLLIFWGAVTSWIVTATGVVVAAVAAAHWIGQLRRGE